MSKRSSLHRHLVTKYSWRGGIHAAAAFDIQSKFAHMRTSGCVFTSKMKDTTTNFQWYRPTVVISKCGWTNHHAEAKKETKVKFGATFKGFCHHVSNDMMTSFDVTRDIAHTARDGTR